MANTFDVPNVVNGVTRVRYVMMVPDERVRRWWPIGYGRLL